MEFLNSLHVTLPCEEITDIFATSSSLPFRAYTKSRVNLEEKIGIFVRDGADKLKVVVDFDFTLTKFMVRDKTPTLEGAAVEEVSVERYNRGRSCHKVLEYSGLMSHESHEKVWYCCFGIYFR